jgi:zeta-carotene desaturase
VIDPPLPDVIVIGGGFAGLAAATALAEAGERVHLLESRPRLGGRATTHRDPITGEGIDNGQHVLAGCYRETLAFLDRIGSSQRLHRPATLRVTMIDERGERSTLALPPLPTPIHLAAGVLAWNAISVRDRLSILRLGPWLLGTKEVRAGTTVGAWLAERRQSPALCRMFWEPLALAALNQPVELASAASFLAVLRRMFGPEPGAASLLLPSVPLDDLYAHPAERFLRAHGSTITTMTRVAVLVEGRRVVAVRVGDTVHDARIVIVAVPWHALGGLFAPVPPPLLALVEQASRLASSPIVTVNLWLDRPVLEEMFVGLPGRTFQWVFDRRRIVGPSDTHLSLVSSGADATCAASNHELVNKALGDIRSAVPAARQAAVRHASVVRERRATFSLAPGSPQRPPAATPVEGLLLAGDWTDTGLPATIESAVASGHTAARLAADLLRRSR